MKLNVLITDDDNSVLFLHEIIVKETNFSKNPVTLINGEKTLEYLLENAENGEAFLILLDLNMPVMNGWELLEALNEHNFSIPIYVVIVTSSINTADHEKAYTFPQVIDYVEKPISKSIIEHLKGLDELKEYFNGHKGKIS
jgi:CheY-like chemotaxis protein